MPKRAKLLESQEQSVSLVKAKRKRITAWYIYAMPLVFIPGVGVVSTKADFRHMHYFVRDLYTVYSKATKFTEFKPSLVGCCPLFFQG